MLAHGLDSCNANEIGRPEMRDEIIAPIHSATEIESSDHVTLTDDMLDYNSDSCIEHEIGSPQLSEELVEQCHSETEVESSDHVTLTVGMCVFNYITVKDLKNNSLCFTKT